MKVELPCPEVDPFRRNVERYARKVEHAYFIRQFTGECRTTKTPISLRKWVLRYILIFVFSKSEIA